MLDLSNLTKLYRTEFAVSQPAQPTAWRAGDKVHPSTMAAHSREFLLEYLLHYCRLSEQLRRRGTVKILQALLEEEPQNGEVHFLLGSQYEMAESLADALDCYERAANLRPDQPSYMLAAVRVACLLGERNKALAMVCSVISAYPVLAEAYYERGLIYEADENWARALKDYEMCGRLEPENAAFQCAIAGMYRQQGLFKMARRAATKALKLDPNCAEAHEELRQLPIFEQLVDLFRSDEAAAEQANEYAARARAV